MMRLDDKVMVCHPGEQHARHDVRALHRVGQLAAYWTSFFYKRDDSIYKLLDLLPQQIRDSLKRELSLRAIDDLPPEFVSSKLPFVELMLAVARRFQPRSRVRVYRSALKAVGSYRNLHFDRAVATYVRRYQPTAVLVYDSASYNTLRACAETRTHGVMSQTIGHIKAFAKIEQEETEAHPEFLIPVQPLSQTQVDSAVQEVQTAEWLITASAYSRGTLLDAGADPGRILVAPYGVDTDMFTPAKEKRQSKDKLKLLFVGSVCQRKGLFYLLETMRRLNMKQLELTIVGGIAGDGRGLDPYREYFTHVPRVPFYALPEVFRAADLFFLPSLHEGSALVTYLALACGLPLVTTPNAGSVVRDGVEGKVVPIRDVEAMMEAILYLYENPDERERMSHAARARALEHTWEHYYVHLADFMRSIMHAQPR